MRDIHFAGCPFLKRKGASGSWAEPYFACPTLRSGGLQNPPRVLLLSKERSSDKKELHKRF